MLGFNKNFFVATSRYLRRAFALTHSLFFFFARISFDIDVYHVVADEKKLNWKENMHTAVFIESYVNFGNTHIFPLTLRPKLFCITKIYFYSYIDFRLETFLYFIFNII